MVMLLKKSSKELNVSPTINRNSNIEILRILFAFLVVGLHMPAIGFSYIYPIVRCAVPFFFFVSGFFMYKPNSGDFRKSIIKNIVKWTKLYILYLIIFLIISVGLKYFLHNIFDFQKSDLLFWIKEGMCPFVDVIKFGTKSYGITTLWFLYAGIIAFCSLKFFYCTIYNRYSLPLILTIFFIFLSINIYFNQNLIPRFALIAIPHVFLGAYIRCHKEEIKKRFNSQRRLYIVLVCCIILAYLEYLILERNYNEIFYTTPLLTVCIFLVAIYSSTWSTAIKHMPSKCTLDIYIWHRLIYFILILMGINFSKWSTPCVFILVFALSYILRKYKFTSQCLKYNKN